MMTARFTPFLAKVLMSKTRFRLVWLGMPPSVTRRWFAGWTEGERYNTCAVPYFETTEALEILEMLKSLRPFFEDAEYDVEYDEFIFCEDIEMKREGRFEGQELDTPDGPKKVYPIGSWCWPWIEEGG